MEGENPTRRYKWFRPRQAARISLIQNAGGNLSTVGLFNNSTGNELLVVRDLFAKEESSGANMNVANYQGTFVTPTVNPAWLVSQAGYPPGQGWLTSTATSLTADWFFAARNDGTGWNHDFPLAILQPGWSLALQTTAATAGLFVGLIYEVIKADELDFMW